MCAVTCAIALGLLSGVAWAEKVPSGPEFQVNTYDPYYGSGAGFYGPRVAADGIGNFIVTWTDSDYLNFRIFDSTGTPQVPDFRITTSSDYTAPSVAANAAGDFVVVWGDNGCGGGSGRICARRFDGSGTPLGSEFEVDSGAYIGGYPKVAADTAGNFVVAWASYDSYSFPVRARRFDSAGAPLGAEFQVNTITTNCCGYSGVFETHDAIEVAAGPAGNFAVVWNRGASDVVARFYDSAGVAQGPDVTVSSQGFFGPEVGIAADSMGRFIVVWDQSAYGVHARRYDGTGAPLGAAFQVSEVTTFQGAPVVSADTAGNFVVSWDEYEGYYSQSAVFGRQFDDTGAPVGPDFRVNTVSYYDSRLPDIASSPSGDFVVVWGRTNAQDFDAVHGQRFSDAGPAGCTAPPMENCRQPTAARKGTLLLKDRSPDSKDKVIWKWKKGEATEIFDYGDPINRTNYALCIYEAGTFNPVLQARATAGGACPGRPCWQQFGTKRFEYKNRDLDPDGLRLMRLQEGNEGKARITVRAKGEHIGMPQLPLDLPVRVQVQASTNQCWEATYEQFVIRNNAVELKAKPDGIACGNSAPACSGECPLGQSCADTGSGCECLSSCGDAAAPACNGTCPANGVCLDAGGVCACGAPPCAVISGGGQSGPPTCGGSCPAGEACGAIDFFSCGCLPTGTTGCAAGGFPTCDGFCGPGRECAAVRVPDLSIDGCDCVPAGSVCGGANGHPSIPCFGQCPAGEFCLVDLGAPGLCIGCTVPSPSGAFLDVATDVLS